MDDNFEQPLEAREAKMDELECAVNKVVYLLKFILKDDKLYEKEGWGKAPAGTQEALDAMYIFVFSDEMEDFYLNHERALKKHRNEKECFDG